MASSSLLVSLTCALLAFWTARYSTVPEFGAVTERDPRDRSMDQVEVPAQPGGGHPANDEKMRRKNRLLMTALCGLFVLVVCVGGYLTYALS